MVSSQSVTFFPTLGGCGSQLVSWNTADSLALENLFISFAMELFFNHEI